MSIFGDFMGHFLGFWQISLKWSIYGKNSRKQTKIIFSILVYVGPLRIKNVLFWLFLANGEFFPKICPKIPFDTFIEKVDIIAASIM